MVLERRRDEPAGVRGVHRHGGVVIVQRHELEDGVAGRVFATGVVLPQGRRSLAVELGDHDVARLRRHVRIDHDVVPRFELRGHAVALDGQPEGVAGGER